MAAPSKSYTEITDSQVDADSPLDTTLMTSLRDNVAHLKEWLGASYSAEVDHDHDGVNSKPIAGIPYVAGDVVLVPANTERMVSVAVMTKKKEIQMLRGGELRLKFDLKSNSVQGLAYGQVYRNGIAVGALRSTASINYVTFSEDIAGWVIGDLAQLYIKATAGGYEAYAMNFQVCVSNGTVNLD